MQAIRKILISWNVAPLLIVAFLCWMTYLLVMNLIGMTCTADPILYGALTALIGTMGGILYKTYNSLQKDNGVKSED